MTTVVLLKGYTGGYGSLANKCSYALVVHIGCNRYSGSDESIYRYYRCGGGAKIESHVIVASFL